MTNKLLLSVFLLICFAGCATTSVNNDRKLLQTNHQFLIQVFDELAAKTPDDIAFKRILNKENKIILIGNAKSDSSATALMHKFDNSWLLMQPKLVEIKPIELQGQKIIEFIIKGSLEPSRTRRSSISSCYSLPPLLPSHTNAETVLSDINRVGIENGIEFERFKPENELSKDEHSELPVQIKVLGSFENLRDFIRSIAQLPVLVVFDTFTIERKNNNKIAMDATIKIYRSLDEIKAGPAGYIAQKSPCLDFKKNDLQNIFSLTRLALKPGINSYRQKEPLETYPLETLKVIGITTIMGKQVALIAADSNVYKVETGSHIGENSGLIVSITKHEVVIKELVNDASSGITEKIKTLKMSD